MLNGLAEKLWNSLLERNLKGRTLTIKIKFADFKIITRSRTKASGFKSVDQLQTSITEILQDVQEPFEIRLLGIGVSNFIDDEEALQFSITFDS